ncbi:hypothetical protein BU26DRAFT_512739 [Trematosphaeria pertusa]|uniref:Glutathione transferase n=1 Tax=Trematosphaeria pertusa TaxID=390896 RepID=A0A6A6IYY2_9PLEO|nr:uncharacterized protein BU26DRAFT_512739 [Trematosphaeria pertusa]KAF2255781.1 hypothetical protein BU26DRAFT_512739 [Trematosphaeria pertusa]
MNSSQLPLHHLQPTAIHLQTLPQAFQNLEAISPEASDGFFQQRYTQHLSQAHPHATPQALHFQQHALPQSQPHFAPFPGGYQQAPRFELSTAPPPVPPPAPPHQHIQAPPRRQPQSQISPIARAPQQQQQQVPEFEPRDEFVTLPVQGQSRGNAQVQDGDDVVISNHGQFEGLKLIPNPPDLEAWRERLFHVDDTITLTQEEFQTYFPHVDNVYSHRSTQRHKRKRFVSHYWDCRLKGRPPGTKKSTDPEKKKRKRVARERDLCDVKIKITEYFDGAELLEQTGQQPPGDTITSPLEAASGNQFFGQSGVGAGGWGMQGMTGAGGVNVGMAMGLREQKKFYTIQRVNGNGGNGKGDGVAGPHKHTLEESDRVKKNSVQRWLMRNEKDRKRVQGGDPTKKTYHKKATGNALVTVKNHSKEEDLKLFGSCFCPFVQRVWISLEHKQIPYQYIEVDPYKKPQSLLEVNPRGLVPAIRHGPTWSTHESTVIMEYFEDLHMGPALLPPDPQTRATCRLWSDHVNRQIVPAFYRLLQAQDTNDQVNHASELKTEIGKLVDAADATGPFFLGKDLGFVDVQVAPWVLRLKRVLGPYRGWPEPEEGSRWKKWVDAIENEPSVRRTTSEDQLYLDSYERYAENRPGTSQVANAVNAGRGLP